MSHLQRRIEQAEEALSIGQGPIIINVVWFGGEPVPPEQRRDNVIVRCVAYESVQKQREGGVGHED